MNVFFPPNKLTYTRINIFNHFKVSFKITFRWQYLSPALWEYFLWIINTNTDTVVYSMPQETEINFCSHLMQKSQSKYLEKLNQNFVDDYKRYVRIV